MQSAYWIQSDIQYLTSENHTMVHYSSDTSYTHIGYPSADPYSTYTMYNPADVRWDVLNDIMSSYNLHNYQILGLNGVTYLTKEEGSSPHILHCICITTTAFRLTLCLCSHI